MSNYTRTHLVTHFNCAICGSPLKLSYENNSVKADYYNDHITGADKVEQTVHVEPCERCMKPSKDILKAVKTLTESGNVIN